MNSIFQSENLINSIPSPVMMVLIENLNKKDIIRSVISNHSIETLLSCNSNEILNSISNINNNNEINNNGQYFLLNQFSPSNSRSSKEKEIGDNLSESILSSFKSKLIVKRKIQIFNQKLNQQFSSLITISPFNDGCICLFGSIKNVDQFIGESLENQEDYYLLISEYEKLAALLNHSPVVIWKANCNGNLLNFRRLDGQKVDNRTCEGSSMDQYMEWVYNKKEFEKEFNFKTLISNENTKSFELNYWHYTEDGGVLPYCMNGSCIQNSKKEIIGWIGYSYHLFMNEGAALGIKENINLNSMFERFKELYSKPQSERVKLGFPEDENKSQSSFKHFIEFKKHLISSEEKLVFYQCRNTYNILFKLSLLGVMFSTLKGQILDANDALLSMIGYTRQDLENGKIDWMLLTPPEFFEISARALQELKAKRWCQPIEKAYFHKNGKKIPILVTCAMIDGSVEQCITFVFDLSRFRKAEAAAIEANKLKSQFITNISHEIRTPCHHILGLTQLMIDQQRNPLAIVESPHIESIESIKKSTDNLLTIINDILDFSKLESGKFTLDISSFELLPMIEEIFESVSETANSKQLDVILLMGTSESPVPPVIFGDRGNLKKILSNLVGNAVKFTESGYVLLQVSTEYESGDQIALKFQIKDTGIGIPEDKLQEIFTPFRQIDGSISRRYGGTGLGLSFCKELIDLMGGSFSIDTNNDVGSSSKGTTFNVHLKVSIASPSYLPTSVPAANQFFYPEFRPSHIQKRVLVIESNPLIISSIRNILQSMKFECIETYTVSSTIEYLSQNRDQPIDTILISDQSSEIHSLFQVVNQEKIIIFGSVFNHQWHSHQKVFSFVTKPITYSKLISPILKSTKSQAPSLISSTESNRSSQDDGKIIEMDDKYILVGEDNEVNIKIITRQLEKLGYHCIIGSNGLKTLELVKSGINISLILMDCQMPEMDGFQCSKIIRSLEPEGQRIPIIALSANDANEESLSSGMDDYLSKPLKMDQLKKALEKWNNNSITYQFGSLKESSIYCSYLSNIKNQSIQMQIESTKTLSSSSE
ncbi:histidine kinase [Tieghemostelium lacteum]|uniref:Histidine kinase n=1 Tax=Tieghemostelium lacteum TaxID=361077 RepID=A0A152A2G1_TIELA|nr:histidine kinase [Tieghemostelium lacteum]|eukprot:KYR00400.1 histidine kinase [Tieghemostelium lacteum]